MSTTPTVEQFLTQPDDHGPEDPAPATIRALDHLTESHAQIVDAQVEQHLAAELVDSGDPLQSIAHSLSVIAAATGSQEPTVSAEAYDGLSQEHADLEDKHRALYALMADVEKIVAKSTSKVSLDVKAAINAWKDPEVEQVTEAPVPVSNAEEMGLRQPAHDAPVEEWRAYARHLGHGRTGAAFNELDQMNRSQIRTYLGVEHGGA